MRGREIRANGERVGVIERVLRQHGDGKRRESRFTFFVHPLHVADRFVFQKGNVDRARVIKIKIDFFALERFKRDIGAA